MPDTIEPEAVLTLIENLPVASAQAFQDRLDTLVRTLTGSSPTTLQEAVRTVSLEVGHAADRLWLSYAVLAAELPTDEEMSDLLVLARLGGTWAALSPITEELRKPGRLREVEVLRHAVVCDVHETASSEFLSGVQRVVRETTRRWDKAHDLEFVSWNNDLTGLRRIRDDDRQRLFGHRQGGNPDAGMPPTIVPWECTHLWVEVITDLRRTGRLLALAQHSRNQVGVLGYDSIPVTSSVTVADGMTSHFARGLAAIRRADRVAMISDAAAAEFAGVVSMGAGRRDRGPDVTAVPLAVTTYAASAADLAEASAGLILGHSPMVLVVGSHEPRKNHLAVLHAAELLWREGVNFNLVLAGAGSWNAGEYDQVVGTLIAAGRPVQSIRGLPDRLLWAAYRLAHCTVFPSLNEGFGLPVAESLAAGTPVVTSDFGSMRDIVAPHGTPLGGLLIDPRDDESLTAGLRTMLSDPVTYERLRAETAQHPERTWDDYAAELWAFLIDGTAPPRRVADGPPPGRDH